MDCSVTFIQIPMCSSIFSFLKGMFTEILLNVAVLYDSLCCLCKGRGFCPTMRLIVMNQNAVHRPSIKEWKSLTYLIRI